ncbi:hypothetical protein PUW87_02070 [Metamycoplasma hyosynoviae]|uniref:DNA polymerase III subunit delta n=1 Tax=Metamycoplasma hyosynoviae TaxID=29559 RepID=A0AAP4EL60_9BACT|nr:hypothetical protein [Metamycoplasma hyosynoviae]MDC8920327.1 hypothetical protein [Metamycoplasma hyosynoviae]MDC8937062.1 hypothetical protein [Metamycoplasma hyosynoviae]MDC8937964.1 hypothetical protein [Metamycoplasma hyosynoviae]MDD1366188.1 hypothetical protein [Metamycoplasma hyosynoviae]MDD7848244.1 hypothetical protein [Metamycoplasma hyosynoviae]
MTNNHYYEIIDNSVKKNKLSQVYLFTALPNTNISKYLIYFINLVNGESYKTEKDIIYGELYFMVDGSKVSIKKEELLKTVNKARNLQSSHESSKTRVLIIKNIENGSPSVLNALLNFLENCPDNLIVLITTNNRNRVLKTIRSRCFEISFSKTTIKHKKEEDDDKFKMFYEYLFEDEEKMVEYYTNENIQLLYDLKKHFATSFNNHYPLLIFLEKKLNDENFFILLSYLLFNLIEIHSKKNNIKITTNFIDEELFQSFEDDEFPFINLINLIKKYLITFKIPNNNFKLQKAAFIGKLGDQYDK